MRPLILAALAALISQQALAFGETGRWSSGWGQGISEYMVKDAKGNQLYIACNNDGETPATMTLTVGRKQYGYGSQQDFVLILDGKAPLSPSDAGSRAGGDNFRLAWDGLRKAKTLVAKTADGKTLSLPLTGAAKALPSSKSKEYSCVTW
ncbi:hypothetical protein [Chromobacterium phragmitis]|uniref:Uncharacterized protein n=1 Tax=Chromobacterium phragmitis TaxID=2202141 RepID=A0ABV0ISG1_9NEIS